MQFVGQKTRLCLTGEEDDDAGVADGLIVVASLVADDLRTWLIPRGVPHIPGSFQPHSVLFVRLTACLIRVSHETYTYHESFLVAWLLLQRGTTVTRRRLFLRSQHHSIIASNSSATTSKKAMQSLLGLANICRNSAPLTNTLKAGFVRSATAPAGNLHCRRPLLRSSKSTTARLASIILIPVCVGWR